MNTTEIENQLRRVPQPSPPAGLKQRLAAQAPALLARQAVQSARPSQNSERWLSRWWPALGPTAVSLACAAAFTVQQIEIGNLEKALANTAKREQAVQASQVSASMAPEVTVENAQSVENEKEIARLKQLVSTLSVDISRLEAMQLENQKLRAQLLTGTATDELTPEEMNQIAEAREKAMAILCVNNMKQLGLATRVWALDNGDVTPPNLLSMTNELSTPKVLACPADTAHPAATGGWAGFSAGNSSYEYLAPSTPCSNGPDRVLFRCPIHGNVTLLDGSVHARVTNEHPEWLVQKDGKLYFQQGRN